MKFVEVPIHRANRLINHGPAILVASHFKGKSNIMTAAWCMPVSIKPPMLAVAIGPTRFSHDLIIQSGEFTVCVPGSDIVNKVMCCGTTSGRDKDKFAHCGLTPEQGSRTKAPLIAECLGAIECRLDSYPTAGDHTIMVGEILAAWAKPGAFSERFNVENHKTLHHLGGREFFLPGEMVTA